MKTIETQLDLFFQSLGHTPGSWMQPPRDNEIMTQPRGDIKICRMYEVSPYDSGDYNAILIQHAPDMLRSLCRTYLWTLIYLPINVRETPHGQGLLSDLRNTIVEAIDPIGNGLGVTSQQVQETFEGYAYDLMSRKFKTTLPACINSVDEAKTYLKELFDNNESYHPDDSAENIEWVGAEPTPEQCKKMNQLMDQIMELDFDPYEYILSLSPVTDEPTEQGNG